MICLKCGAQLPEGAAFCKNCGTIAGSKFQKVNSPLYRTEKAIRDGLCSRVKSGNKLENGKALLTSHRFVYFKLGLSRTFQMIFLKNMTTGDIYIPLTEIRSIKSGCQYSDKTLIISTKSGETYTFIFKDHLEWKIAIQRAVAAIK